MAYIQFENTDLVRYHNSEYMPDDYWIENISEKGVAQVKQEVAEELVENKDDVSHYTNGD